MKGSTAPSGGASIARAALKIFDEGKRRSVVVDLMATR